MSIKNPSLQDLLLRISTRGSIITHYRVGPTIFLVMRFDQHRNCASIVQDIRKAHPLNNDAFQFGSCAQQLIAEDLDS